MKYYDANLNGKMKRVVVLPTVLVVLAVLFSFVAKIYVDYIEVKELGEEFLTVFWTNFTVRTIAQAISFAVCFVLFYLSTYIVYRNMKKSSKTLIPAIERMWSHLLVCALLSFVASTLISETVYSQYLMFCNSTSFNLVDPLFGNDIGYYVFQRPFLDALVGSISSVWMVVTLYSLVSYAVIYAVNGLLNLERITYDRPVVIHNVVNVVVLFLIKAVTYKFRSEEVLYSTVGEFAGAGYTEINVWFNFYRIAPFLVIAIIVVSLFFMAKGKYKAMLASIVAYPVIFVAVSVVAFGVQKIVVDPNEAVKERPYIENNLQYTKLAYNINGVSEKEFPAQKNLTVQDLTQNKSTFDSIRITDFNSTISAVNSLQSIRNYYKFNDSDVTKYNINGVETMVSIAPREIDKSGLSDSAKSYANEVFRFTHGFGAVMSPLNKVTDEGQPLLYIKNIPPVSMEGVPEIKQPRIYYGEVKDDNVIVNSNLSEIDYYDGSKEVEYKYEGKGGIKLNLLNRIIYSIKNADFKMLISEFVTPESRILINRNVKTRVEKAIPFLKFDSDPYMLIDDNGNLKWIIDGYTTSTHYPYSQTYEGVNYIRNSVKAVVDAYNGDIKLYVMDSTDPMIKTYMKMYPGVFSEEYLPAGISEHIVYPEYLFTIQAQVYAKYHVSNPNTLYNKSDLWVFSKEKYGSKEQSILPYYNLMNIDELSGNENFIIMIPYTLTNKNNMVGWLAGCCDYENYGKLVAYHFPKGENVYGTMQIENRIDTDPAISREMTLWGQGGSNVIRGNMLVVPVENSLLYIEPIYISSIADDVTAAGAIPELKRVIVAYGENIVMETSLEKALTAIFNLNPYELGESENEQEDQVVDGEPTLNDVIDKVVKFYNSAKESNSNGDWYGFGKGMQDLDSAIKELEKYRSENETAE